MSGRTGKRGRRRAQGKGERPALPADQGSAGISVPSGQPAATDQRSAAVSALLVAAAQRHQSGQLAEAEVLYGRVLELNAGHLEGLHNLGVLAQQTGRYGLARTLFGRAIARNGGVAQFHQSLADTLRLQGKLEEAEASYQRAIALKPDAAQAHHNLAATLNARGKLDEAAASYRRAIALKPDFAGAHHNLGNLFVRLGRVEEAVACLRRAAALQTAGADVWFSLGRALAIQGDLGSARGALLRAIELDPHAEEAVYTLAGLQPMNDGSPEAERAFAVVSRLAGDLDQLAPGKRPPALFAIARALEDRGDFDRAFGFMAQANAIIRAGLSFDVGDDERRMDAIAKIFDRRFLERLKDAGSASERPIFILGMARSGTTLIEQILSAHPAVHGAGELMNLTSAIMAHSSRGGSTYTPWAKALTGAGCGGLARTYLDSLPAAPRGEARTTDKGVGNFEQIGLIHLALPNARIIHCVRDPRDVGLSCYGALFRHQHRHCFDLVDLGRYWRAYDKLMAHWRTVLPPGRMLEVPYEDVVNDVEAWARRLIAHCGLEWDDACLRFYESGRPVNTASLAQVRQAIYANSVGRWRRFAPYLKPLLETLGEPWAEVTNPPGP